MNLAAFMVRVDTSGGVRACWPWLGVRDPDGYGRTTTNERAHRVALELRLGRALGDGMQSLHSCDNPPCVNPAHLFEGTNDDNILDALAKGRRTTAMPQRWPHQGMCGQGHAITGTNRTIGRRCRICTNRLARERYQRRDVPA